MLYLSRISPYYPSGKDGGGEKTRRMKWTEARRRKPAPNRWSGERFMSMYLGAAR
jgi:hypothetical protein